MIGFVRGCFSWLSFVYRVASGRCSPGRSGLHFAGQKCEPWKIWRETLEILRDYLWDSQGILSGSPVEFPGENTVVFREILWVFAGFIREILWRIPGELQDLQVCPQQFSVRNSVQ